MDERDVRDRETPKRHVDWRGTGTDTAVEGGATAKRGGTRKVMCKRKNTGARRGGVMPSGPSGGRCALDPQRCGVVRL